MPSAVISGMECGMVWVCNTLFGFVTWYVGVCGGVGFVGAACASVQSSWRRPAGAGAAPIHVQ